MKLDDKMKMQIKVYTIIAFIVIMMYFTVLRIDEVKQFISNTLGLLSPFIFGVVVAFLLNKPLILTEKMLEKLHFSKKTARPVAAVISLILGLMAVVLVFALIVPQLIDSVFSLIEQAPGMIEAFVKQMDVFFAQHNMDSTLFDSMFGADFIPNTLSKLTTKVTEALPKVWTFGSGVVSTILNILVGLVAGLYMMLEKENFIKGLKKTTYAFLKIEAADYLTRFANITARVFNDFILGKALDSLVIGILTYVLMTVFNMPFALLLSVIVGITNMIPVFGPFIGAIPGCFILLIFDPMKGVYFALLILAIQQFDGNILGPIILGDKLGLPSLAILFSVVVGGGLFGIVGMFIGVPIFAVIYLAVSEIIDERLKRKNLDI